VLALRPRITAAEALARLRDLGHKSISRIFLVDPAEVLVGSVRVRDLAVAEPSARLQELMVEGPAGVPVTADREEVSEVLERERVASLPVVDFEGRLVGVLAYDVLIDAARDDATVDMQAMVGAGREERALSPIRFAVKKRLPWLQVNLLTAFLAASVVGLFESTIASFTALAVLLPVVAGQSGNTGAQALAVTMRGLALREIRARQWLRVCMKESGVALLNGLAVALTTSLAVFLWSRSIGLALVIGSSMVISMVVAGLSGAATPMALTALGQDPAQSSSIILTTVTDVVGFFSFLGIATLLSRML
ncbi:MAG: magnesium transporter, partial [Thermoanaerobaculia bacterium]|nr:magnesium transporter [Thermoanaerobaculia bacterium]